VLLNMLIALMNDTWSTYKDQEEYLGLKGKAQLLVEYEARLGKKTLAHEDWFPKWLHVIKKGRTPQETSEDGSVIEALAMDPPKGDLQKSPTDRILDKVDALQDALARKQEDNNLQLALEQTQERFGEIEGKISRLEDARASAQEELQSQLRTMQDSLQRTMQELLDNTKASSSSSPRRSPSPPADGSPPSIPAIPLSNPVNPNPGSPGSEAAGGNATRPSPRRRRFVPSLRPGSLSPRFAPVLFRSGAAAVRPRSSTGDRV